MLNLLTVVGLLFTSTLYTTNTLFSSHLTNDGGSRHSSFSSFVTDSNGNTSRVNDPTNIKVGTFSDGFYTSVFDISFPSYTATNISSSSLTLYKQSGYFGTLKAAYSYSFDFNTYQNIIPSSFSWTYWSDFNYQGNWFNLNLTNLIKNAVSSNYNHIYLKIYYENSNYSTIFGNNQYSSSRPVFNLSYLDVPTTGHYGNATAFNANSAILSNCYGYAFDHYVYSDDVCYIEDDGWGSTTYSSNTVETVFIPRVINYSKNALNVNARRIDSYDSAIFPFERRVACRLKIGGNDYTPFCYHFIRQDSDGGWSFKNSVNAGGPSRACTNNDPSLYNWDSGKYDSDIYYFAISVLGGHLHYHAY